MRKLVLNRRGTEKPCVTILQHAVQIAFMADLDKRYPEIVKNCLYSVMGDGFGCGTPVFDCRVIFI
jgi:hypothetical protein